MSPVLAHLGRVRVISGQWRFGRIVHCLMRPLPHLAFVSVGEIENGKEGLSCGAVCPMGLAAGVVPDDSGFLEVIVLLVVVCAVVAGLPKVLRVHQEAGRKLRHAPHVFRARAGGIKARDERRASRSTYGCIGPAIRVNGSFGGQCIEPRRIRVTVPVASKLWSGVLAGEPQDIGTRNGLRRTRQVAARQQSDRDSEADELARSINHVWSFPLRDAKSN